MSELNTIFSNLAPSDYIQILGIISSFILSAIAIIISVYTAWKNSKTIEAANRPVIHIYPVYINSILYIIIKNAGASVAYIDEISCSHKFTEDEVIIKNLGENIFSSLQQAIFTPGYSIKCPLFGTAIADEFLAFYIRYHSSSKVYTDSFCFQPASNAPFANMYPSNSESVENNLYEITKQLCDLVKNTL